MRNNFPNRKIFKCRKIKQFMEERTFSDILAISTAIAEKSKVEQLRELSKAILNDIFSINKGIFVVTGVRGSGKTTILSKLYEKEKNAIFINSEIILRFSASLLDFLHYTYAKGYKIFLIDEIHSLPEWEKDIKIFFDETKEKIVISGSSAIELKVKGSELSRRAKFYEIKPFSFREYLFFRTGKNFPKITIKNIISIEKRKELEKMIAPYLNYFPPYLHFDALPAAFFEKNKDVYINILERTIRYDLAYLKEIDISYIDNVFKAIKVIATSSPGELSYSSLASSLGVGLKLAKEIINSLAQTGIIYKIPPQGRGKKAVRKEEKILMPLSFRSALCSHYGVASPKGSLREDFFVQHVGKCFYLKTGVDRRTPDFVVQDYIFEVGGPSKNYEQIKDLKNAFLVKEALPLGEKEIPLYLFGFLY